MRVWAEWFALLSGTMYLPWEILKLMERVDWDRVAVLLINLIIILYMLIIRIRERGIPGFTQNDPAEQNAVAGRR
jgi:uncharacterized membrane protein (DUF2068 family)